MLTACAIEPEAEDAHAGMSSNVDPAMVTAGHHHPMAPLEDMPENVRAADARTQEAYRFAVANPDAAHEVPCYCGCVALGHTSSYGCYVAGTDPDGALVFDAHAVNCTVCVDITQDQMRLMDGGASPEAIRAYLDENYSMYGPPTEFRTTNDESGSG
ncbi:MAG: hypothetical protein IPM60_15330 [Rhodospirillales bacterium]|nr:hypothetical protein [Rhodospirillales bacterium]